MKNIKSIALIAFLTLSMTAMAQPDFGPTGGTDVEDAQAPIPGIALAIAAAVGIGFVKLKRKK
ncbi:hypothetical protein [Nonlabens ulvanivorans]|uniref:hypothetical protein n=1 Tax=Nonlabens ulvanivorans TaxID=906888 RepID=UPI0037CC880D